MGAIGGWNFRCRGHHVWRILVYNDQDQAMLGGGATPLDDDDEEPEFGWAGLQQDEEGSGVQRQFFKLVCHSVIWVVEQGALWVCGTDMAMCRGTKPRCTLVDIGR